VLRKIFGSKKEEVTGDWRKLHTEGLHDLHFSPDSIWVIKEDEMGDAFGTYGEKRCA
jgi:hypothetical protein